jgi:hypothetical protein
VFAKLSKAFQIAAASVTTSICEGRRDWHPIAQDAVALNSGTKERAEGHHLTTSSTTEVASRLLPGGDPVAT